MLSFANRILSEKKFEKKVELIYLLKKEKDIFFDNSIVFKGIIVKLFIEAMELDVDSNEVVTAMLMCECKKIDNAQDIKKINSYAKEGAELLKELGFSKEFCLMSEQHNRYSNNIPRKKESDILELADQFGGMLIDRAERTAFSIEEAITLLEFRNLKGANNYYLENFKRFITIIKELQI